MTPDRLRHLASRAAAGELDVGEQREVMEHFSHYLKSCSEFAASSGSSLSDWYEELAAAASLPEVKEEQCQLCGKFKPRDHMMDLQPICRSCY